MKEALVILLVLAVLLALTAVRYRKQIAGVLGVARMLKEAKRAAIENSRNSPLDGEKVVPLVNCSECGVWVPRTKAIKVRDVPFCSNTCLQAAKVN